MRGGEEVLHGKLSNLQNIQFFSNVNRQPDQIRTAAKKFFSGAWPVDSEKFSVRTAALQKSGNLEQWKCSRAVS